MMSTNTNSNTFIREVGRDRLDGTYAGNDLGEEALKLQRTVESSYS